MPDYKQGKIYKLCSDVSPLIYVGSTCNSLTKRKRGHKDHAKTHSNRIVYKHINQVGWQHYEIILIENYPCNDKNELRARERYYKDLLKPEINRNSPICFENEAKQKDKQYKKTHREQIKQQRKQYRETHKEQIKQYLDENKDRIKINDQMRYLNLKLKKTDEEYNKVVSEWNLLKHKPI